MTYPFRQGIDYGPRKGTLGLALHMSEGGDGLVDYLARRPGETDAQWRTRIRGVSANACFLSDGTVWQMVDWTHASGSMNPADRNPATTGYYNGTIIRDVLGDHYVDPNAWSISAEIAGRRADGPTDAQVRAVIAWGRDMAAMFPTLRGAYGHADQTDTKGCPGTTPNMRAIFDGLGGHGLWVRKDSDVRFATVIAGKRLPVKKGAAWKYLDGSAGGVFGSDAVVDVKGKADAHNGEWVVQISTGNPYADLSPRPTLVLVESSAALVDAPEPAPPDCSQAIAAAVTAERDRVKQAAAAAATTAIGGVQ